MNDGPREKIIIKKYRNRRLYDVREKRYITLDELTERIRDGYEVQILDSTTGEDITQAVLIQLILEGQKSNTHRLFTSEVLHRLIQYRDKSTSEFFQHYLPNILDGYMEWNRQAQNQFMNWAKLGWSAARTPEMFNPAFGMWGRGDYDERNSEESYKTSQKGPDVADARNVYNPVGHSDQEVADLKKRITELENLLKKSQKTD